MTDNNPAYGQIIRERGRADNVWTVLASVFCYVNLSRQSVWSVVLNNI